jgi:hypothetical protein
MRHLITFVIFFLSISAVADAAVLCARRRKSGTFNSKVKIREVCRRKEAQLDLAALGLQGPPGQQGPNGDPGPQGTPGVPAWAAQCPSDSVKVGTTCVDRYEASVWTIPAANTALIQRVRVGEATLGDLIGGGATPVSASPSCSPAFPGSFDGSGNWTAPLYAASIPSVLPSACITWFQAEQACALSGKRLLTNQEWQRAAAGTPDPGNADDGVTTCDTNSAGPVNTGSRSACVSNWGAFDMVGNVFEWVADWVPQSTECPGWGGFSDDRMCLSGASTSVTGPGVFLRGGGFSDGSYAGVFSVFAIVPPWDSGLGSGLGFRCAR